MEFGEVPTASAQGAILAHSIDLASGRLRKGRVLTCEDQALLRSEGITTVTVARLGPGDLGEDLAALAIAEALVAGGSGLRLAPVGTGRVNVHATGPGVLGLDAARVAAVNGVDAMITLATLRPLRRVDAEEMVATVKIIAYGLPAAAVTLAASAGQGAMTLHAPQIASADFVETRLGDDPGDKGWRVTRDRLDRMGLTLAPRVEVPHQIDALAEAIRASTAPLVLILTASATSDPHDVAPEALRRAGGTVIRFGMPVDPGNLLFLGRLDGRWVIGLPGCARSPALNGADWVMERVICGLPPDGEEIAGMGVGGLLKEIPLRPRPRQG